MCYVLLPTASGPLQSNSISLTRCWWDNSNGDRKICWVAWDKLTTPKNLGGLGFRDVLAKIAWRILTKPHCLLARILLGKHCHSQSFLMITSTTDSSHGWKDIIWGRDLLLNHLSKFIGDGNSTSVWRDTWISPRDNLRPFGPSTLQDQDILVADLLSPETKEWNLTKLNMLFPDLTHIIRQIIPSKLGAGDAYIWPLQKSGIYSTKADYASQVLAAASFSPVTNVATSIEWKKLVWTPRSPKLKFFLWIILHIALPTGENLQRRGMRANTVCCRCGAVETTTHLFFH